MTQPNGAVVGRERELAIVDAFVTTSDGRCGSLALTGVAGIGKTTIWTHGVATAVHAGVPVRSSRCTVADEAWPFSGLGDLFEGIGPEILDDLPDVQRAALSAALLIDPTPPNIPTDRIVGVAVLSVIRALCRSGPLLLAIDDVQWLDPASQAVLSFALRRLESAPVRLLVTRRTATSDADSTEPTSLDVPGTNLHVDGVSVSALQQIVRSAAVDLSVSRPMLTRLHHATGGNPMFALEMSRALQRRGSEPQAEEPLAIPSDMRQLVAERLAGLSASSRDVLLVSSALAHPTLSCVRTVVDNPTTFERDLEELARAGALHVDGERLRIAHPLLSSVPYEGLSHGDRRSLHRRIAAAATDPEEHARHAALGVDGPDAAVAVALDVAAAHARGRGLAAAAAELASLAVARTPAHHSDDVARRRLVAAQHVFHIGDPTGARAMAEAVLEQTPRSSRLRRVDALLLLAMMEYWTEGSPSAAMRCEQALQESEHDRPLLARCHASIADLAPLDAPRLLEHARHAIELLEGDADAPADLLANALKNVAYHAFRLGQGISKGTLDRAIELEARCDPLPVLERVGMYQGMLCRFAGDFDEARAWLLAMLQSALDEGDDSALPTIYGHLALLECWTGEFATAMSYVGSGNEFTELTGVGSPSVTAAHAYACAATGDIDEGRRVAAAAVADDEAQHDDGDVGCDLRSFGFVELVAGNLEAAADHLLRALSIVDQLGVLEPSILRMHGDAVEALVGLGRIAEAERLTVELESQERLQSAWARTIAWRCRGMIAFATGDADGAETALNNSLLAHRSIAMPLEEARTRLWLGMTLRRAGRRRDARAALTAALRSFESIGSPPFAERARLELGRLGGRSAATDALTPTEARVAELVGSGLTNAEVATGLFINVRTVESHLGRIYRKLGVRSRTELASSVRTRR